MPAGPWAPGAGGSCLRLYPLAGCQDPLPERPGVQTPSRRSQTQLAEREAPDPTHALLPMCSGPCRQSQAWSRHRACAQLEKQGLPRSPHPTHKEPPRIRSSPQEDPRSCCLSDTLPAGAGGGAVPRSGQRRGSAVQLENQACGVLEEGGVPSCRCQCLQAPLRGLTSPDQTLPLPHARLPFLRWLSRAQRSHTSCHLVG